MPFFRSLVVMVMAMTRSFGCVGEAAAAVGGDDDRVLDADAAVLGKVDARLDGDDVAGGERSSRTVGDTRGASWMSRPTPWPVPWRNASPQPAVGDDRRGRRASTSGAGDAGARPRPPRPPGLSATTSSMRCLGRRRLADARPCGSCPSSSRRPGRRSRARPGRPSRDAAVGRAGGGAWPRSGPTADDRLEATVPLGARAGASRCRARGRTRPRSGRRAAGAGPRPGRASAMAAAASMRATSPASLTRRRASTRPSVATSSASGNHSSA